MRYGTRDIFCKAFKNTYAFFAVICRLGGTVKFGTHHAVIICHLLFSYKIHNENGKQ